MSTSNPAIDIGRCVCGRRIVATTDPPGVGHEEPECAMFQAMEPDDFVHYIRSLRQSGLTTVKEVKA